MANGLTPVGVELVAAGGAQFAAGVQAASKQLNVLERSAKSATAGVNLLGQIGIGVLREIGAIGVRALAQAGRAALNFASDLTAAALENSALSKTVDTLYNSLIEVTRVSFTPLANQINQLATQAAPAFLGVVQRAEEAFAGLASNALTYGQNVVAQFAQGLWDGFVYVVDALTGLGDLISGWLAPGSPPKILPELDQWGTDAMNVYLSGWTKANFDIFNTIGSEIESLLRAQAPKNDTGLIPRILGTREAIAAAVEQARQMGQVTTESLNNIYKAAGATTPAVQDYLKSVFTLDLANKNLSAAQAELNRVTAEYQDLLKPIDAQLAGISESQQQLTDEQEKGRLAMVLADPGATASEKRQAQLRIEQIDAEARRRALIATQKVAVEAAQENVDAAQTQVTVAQSEYDSRKANIDLIVEQNRLLAEQAALLDRLSAAGGGGGGAVPKPSGGKGGGGGIVKPDTTWIDDLVAKVQTKLTELQTAWAAAWLAMETAMQPIVDAWNNTVLPALTALQTAFSTSMPDIQASIGRMVGFATQNLNIVLPGVFRNLGRALESMATIWNDTHLTIIGIVEGAFKIIWTVISVTLLLISGLLAVYFLFIGFAWNQFTLLLAGDWAGMWENITTALSDAWIIIEDTLTTALEAILLLAGTDLETFETTWSGIWDNLGIIVSTVVGNIGTAIGGLATDIGTWMGGIMTTIQPVIDALLTLFGLQAKLPGQHTTSSLTPIPQAQGGDWMVSKPTLFMAGEAGPERATFTPMRGSVRPPAKGGANYTVVNNTYYGNSYDLSVSSPQPSRGVINDFAVMQVWAR